MTTRETSPDLDNILGKSISVLDKGFIRVIDYMGNDNSIVQSARVSYGKGTKQLNEDRGLIRYLMKHRHTSPFEMNEIKLHIKMPIFIARQWIRHRTANVNEYSARYSMMTDDYYIPSMDKISTQSNTNKQGRGENLDITDAERIRNSMISNSENLYLSYSNMIDSNVAREISRITLSLNYYTEMYWKIDLHNLLHFLKLRMDSHAQYEIREYANAIARIVAKWVPITHEAFEDYILNGNSVSAMETDVITQLLENQGITKENEQLTEILKNSNITRRETDEFLKKFNLK